METNKQSPRSSNVEDAGEEIPDTDFLVKSIRIELSKMDKSNFGQVRKTVVAILDMIDRSKQTPSELNERIEYIVREIFYSPATNNKAKTSIEKGILMIKKLLATPPLQVEDKREEVSNYDLGKLYDWILDEERKPAITAFTASVVRNIASEFEFALHRAATPNPMKGEDKTAEQIWEDNTDDCRGVLMDKATFLKLWNSKPTHPNKERDRVEKEAEDYAEREHPMHEPDGTFIINRHLEDRHNAFIKGYTAALSTRGKDAVEDTVLEKAFLRRALDMFRRTGGNVTINPGQD